MLDFEERGGFPPPIFALRFDGKGFVDHCPWNEEVSKIARIVAIRHNATCDRLHGGRGFKLRHQGAKRGKALCLARGGRHFDNANGAFDGRDSVIGGGGGGGGGFVFFHVLSFVSAFGFADGVSIR